MATLREKRADDWYWSYDRHQFYRKEKGTGRKRYIEGLPPPNGRLMGEANSEMARQFQNARLLDERRAARSRPVVRKKTFTPPDDQALAINMAASTPLFTPLMEIVADPLMNDFVAETMGRMTEYSTPLAALLAGVAMNPIARAYMDKSLDNHWDSATPSSFEGKVVTSDIVVGAGLHAAVYCGVRRQMQRQLPLVIERSDRVGGAFAMSQGPSFFLNSRNRPGKLSIPFDKDGALNVIPGAPVQPSDIDGSEYQTNDTMAFCIRAALAYSATVVKGVNITETAQDGGSVDVFFEKKKTRTGRVIIATGLSNPRRRVDVESNRLLTFPEFMAMMDRPFPFRGMDRIAVVGAGDSGKTAIEVIAGQGPMTRSSPSLDWPARIDWYGAGAGTTRDSWESSNRSRYKGIGRLLPCRVRGEIDTSRPARVTPLERPANWAAGYECVFVNEVPYDYVIDCTGYSATLFDGSRAGDRGAWTVGNRAVARTYRVLDPRVFIVGPAAYIPSTDVEEQVLSGISENAASMFRYVPRTAALAGSFA